MTLTPLYYLLITLLFATVIVAFANALVLKHRKEMRVLLFLFCAGLLGTAVYYAGAGVGVVDTTSPLARDLFRLALILTLSSLLSIFGVPLRLHLRRAEDETKNG